MAVRKRIGRHVYVQQTGRGYWPRENKICYTDHNLNKVVCYDAGGGGRRKVKALKLRKNNGKWTVNKKAAKRLAPLKLLKNKGNWHVVGSTPAAHKKKKKRKQRTPTLQTNFNTPNNQWGISDDSTQGTKSSKKRFSNFMNSLGLVPKGTPFNSSARKLLFKRR